MARGELELLSWPAAGGGSTPADKRPPLLFVHGAFSAAWCWDEAFLPWFAGKGYDAYAVSLRGHGLSPGQGSVSFATIENYVSDVVTTLDRLPAPPVLVGHSMGGFVVQQVLRRWPDRVAGLALMASTPPHGLYVSSVSMAARYPLLAHALMMVQLLGPNAANLKVIAQALFSKDMPFERVSRHFNRFQPESLLVAWESIGFGLAHWPGKVEKPVMVMGAADDQFVPRFEVENTAAAFGVSPVIIDRMAHAMMLDVRWEDAARALLDWLNSAVVPGETADRAQATIATA